MGTSWRASCPHWPSVRGNSWPMITLFSSQGGFCATATPCWALRPLGLEASERGWWAHSTRAPAQAARLLSPRGRGRSPACAGCTAQASRPLTLLQARGQLVPSLVAYHVCRGDDSGKTGSDGRSLG